MIFGETSLFGFAFASTYSYVLYSVAFFLVVFVPAHTSLDLAGVLDPRYPLGALACRRACLSDGLHGVLSQFVLRG